jgi:hypothetical protein
MRDIDTIDAELRLLVAIRHMVGEAEGRPPSTAWIDELLDERAATLAAGQDDVETQAGRAPAAHSLDKQDTVLLITVKR